MLIAIAGTIGYIAAGLPHQALLPPMSLGFVSLIGVAVIAPISSWAAPWGARLAHALPSALAGNCLRHVPVAGRRAISWRAWHDQARRQRARSVPAPATNFLCKLRKRF